MRGGEQCRGVGRLCKQNHCPCPDVTNLRLVRPAACGTTAVCEHELVMAAMRLRGIPRVFK